MSASILELRQDEISSVNGGVWLGLLGGAIGVYLFVNNSLNKKQIFSVSGGYKVVECVAKGLEKKKMFYKKTVTAGIILSFVVGGNLLGSFIGHMLSG